jgi:hypothetical protein
VGRTYTVSFWGGVVGLFLLLRFAFPSLCDENIIFSFSGADYSTAEPCSACPAPMAPMSHFITSAFGSSHSSFNTLAPNTDVCNINSYGSSAVQDLANRAGIQSCATEQACVNEVWNAVKNQTSQWVWNVYFAKSTKEFYMIKNCRLYESASNPYCPGSATPWIVYVKGALESYRRVYNLDANGQMGTQLGTEATTYDPTTRFWYSAFGWSTTQTFAAGGQGTTYSLAFNGGVAAADRTAREPCGVCMTSSVTVGAATDLASMHLRRFTNANDANAIRANIKVIFDDFMRLTQYRRNLVNLYVGASNNDFYMVTSCRLPENGNQNTYCAAAGTDYVALVRNTLVYSDDVRHSWALNADGTFGAVGPLSGQYNTTQRAWYLGKLFHFFPPFLHLSLLLPLFN